MLDFDGGEDRDYRPDERAPFRGVLNGCAMVLAAFVAVCVGFWVWLRS